MPREAVPAVVLFIALVLCAGLTALAASGHFPPEHRGASLRSGVGRAIGAVSCVMRREMVSALALLVGAAAAWALLPWPAAVIAAGAAMLATPLLLRPLPDAFVNGRAALLAFASASALLALVLALLSLQ